MNLKIIFRVVFWVLFLIGGFLVGFVWKNIEVVVISKENDMVVLVKNNDNVVEEVVVKFGVREEVFLMGLILVE